VPLVGEQDSENVQLGALLVSESEAGGRHKRRTKRNKHRSGDDKKNRTGK
jgi:hypothetical protein